MKSPEHKWDQLIGEGYCLFEDVLDADMLERLRQVTDRLLDEQTAEDGAAQRSTGSMISVWEDPLFGELVSYPRALEALRSIGFLRPKFSSGFVPSRPGARRCSGTRTGGGGMTRAATRLCLNSCS